MNDTTGVLPICCKCGKRIEGQIFYRGAYPYHQTCYAEVYETGEWNVWEDDAMPDLSGKVLVDEAELAKLRSINIDLLAACKALVEIDSGHAFNECICKRCAAIRQAKAAIARAKGEGE
jgi:hypothetical protein